MVPKPRDVELLEALDRWVRSLAATLATGKSVTDAIRVSRRTAPPLIAEEIGTLVRPPQQPLGDRRTPCAGSPTSSTRPTPTESSPP